MTDETPGNFASVLVGVDGGQGGQDAIALARLLIAPGGTMVLAHIRSRGLFSPTAGDEDLEARPAPECEAGRTMLEHERAKAAVTAALTHTAARSVAEGLNQVAARSGSDLLVVGSSRRPRAIRLLRGSEASETLDRAHRPVAVAPRGFVPERLKVVGVGYDASPESEAALAAARALADRYGATVRAVDVVEPPSYSSLGAVAWGEPLQEELCSRQTALTSLADVNGEAVLGLTDQQLLTLSGEVDLLVVGSRGYGRFGRIVHNSVSHYLAGRARCPLLVLPRPAIAGLERDRVVENTADSDLGT